MLQVLTKLRRARHAPCKFSFAGAPATRKPRSTHLLDWETWLHKLIKDICYHTLQLPGLPACHTAPATNPWHAQHIQTHTCRLAHPCTRSAGMSSVDRSPGLSMPKPTPAGGRSPPTACARGPPAPPGPARSGPRGPQSLPGLPGEAPRDPPRAQSPTHGAAPACCPGPGLSSGSLSSRAVPLACPASCSRAAGSQGLGWRSLGFGCTATKIWVL